MEDDLFDQLVEVIDQPKANSGKKVDFNLVPFCSYGHDTPLETCTFAQKSKFKYQDDTCYTFDLGKTATPYAPNGLNLLLNLRQMPTDENLSLKVFVHEN